jgi:hypothetical protein
VRALSDEPNLPPAAATTEVAPAREQNPLRTTLQQVPERDAEPRLHTEAAPSAEPVPTPPVAQDPAAAEPRTYYVPLANPTQNNVDIRQEAGRLSLIVRDGTLNDVLTRLAETQGLNLVTAETLTTRLTITLDRVTVEQALDAILAVAGYTWVRNGDIVFITSLAGETAVAPETQGRQLEIFSLDFASAEDLNQAVTGLLSPAGKAYITTASAEDNHKTHEAIAVEDVPRYLDRIRSYIAQADQPPRQVLIEAHVLQVELDDDCQHGVNLSRVFQLFNKTVNPYTVGLANAAATQALFFDVSSRDVEALVECLQTTTDAKTLASPRILVLNGQKARMQVGEQLGFRVTTTTETMTTESVEFLDVGVVLEVTPRISRDGRVTMRVRPEVSSGQVNPATGLPEEETTELETDVMLTDNQGIVIGGLIQETVSDVQAKIPWLGDLWLVGWLFQRSETILNRSEIIITLVPRVMPYNPVYEMQVAEETMRAETPLTCGPLLRNPRPWEPMLRDAVRNPICLRLPPVFGCGHAAQGGEEVHGPDCPCNAPSPPGPPLPDEHRESEPSSVTVPASYTVPVPLDPHSGESHTFGATVTDLPSQRRTAQTASQPAAPVTANRVAPMLR